MRMEVTQVKHIEAPMNLGMGDRIAVLNIYLRDLQKEGARIMATRQTDTGWEIEYMGEPAYIIEEEMEEEEVVPDVF